MIVSFLVIVYNLSHDTEDVYDSDVLSRMEALHGFSVLCPGICGVQLSCVYKGSADSVVNTAMGSKKQAPISNTEPETAAPKSARTGVGGARRLRANDSLTETPTCGRPLPE